ncbi:MAG: DNA/RNA nuclease SfsA [Firmicutes bacterium]|nr:DNA/RNA nuclease SfsA [Bacillota bacterium]
MMPGFTRNASLLKETIFVSRPNRFLAIVRPRPGNSFAGDASDGLIYAHVADPGRLEELLVPGRRVYLAPVGSSPDSPPGRPGGPSSIVRRKTAAPRKAARRRTAYDLVLVDFDGTLLSVDSRVPNEIVFEALQMRFFKELEGYSIITREARYGEGRLDFRLSRPSGRDCLIEVKSVTLVREGRALFPDAPTLRGARHMRELARAVAGGLEAIVIFIVQRGDAHVFSPNDTTDPEFGRALREAAEEGVEIWAYACCVTPAAIRLDRRIPVIL